MASAVGLLRSAEFPLVPFRQSMDKVARLQPQRMGQLEQARQRWAGRRDFKLGDKRSVQPGLEAQRAARHPSNHCFGPDRGGLSVAPGRATVRGAPPSGAEGAETVAMVRVGGGIALPAQAIRSFSQSRTARIGMRLRPRPSRSLTTALRPEPDGAGNPACFWSSTCLSLSHRPFSR